MGPHSYFRGHVNELEVRGHGLEVALALVDLDLEKCIIEAVSVGFIDSHRRELLVGRVVR